MSKGQSQAAARSQAANAKHQPKKPNVSVIEAANAMASKRIGAVTPLTEVHRKCQEGPACHGPGCRVRKH